MIKAFLNQIKHISSAFPAKPGEQAKPKDVSPWRTKQAKRRSFLANQPSQKP